MEWTGRLRGVAVVRADSSLRRSPLRVSNNRRVVASAADFAWCTVHYAGCNGGIAALH